MKMVRRAAALILALAVSFTAGYTDISAASVSGSSVYISEESAAPEADTQEEKVSETKDQEISQGEAVPETESPEILPEENVSPEAPETEAETSGEEDTSADALEEPVSTGNPEEIPDTEEGIQEETEESLEEETEEKTEETGEIGLVNFLVVQEPMVTTPGTQRIMTSIGDGTSKVESAVLT